MVEEVLREEGWGWGCTDGVGGACLSLLDDKTSILCGCQKIKNLGMHRRYKNSDTYQL